MIASLPMYWRDENAHIWQNLWHDIQNYLGATDQTALIEPEDIPDLFAHWLYPNLTLSMTCGLPFRTKLKEKVAYVGTIDFGTTDHAGHYCSVAVARKNLRNERGDLRLAYNMHDSQSGWAASFDPAFNDLKSRVTKNVQTGAHAASFEAVMNDDADFAFLDSVTWNLLNEFDERTKSAEVLGRTTPTPGLPLITARGNDVEKLQKAIQATIDDIGAKDAHLIGGVPRFEILTPQEYYAVPLPPAV